MKAHFIVYLGALILLSSCSGEASIEGDSVDVDSLKTLDSLYHQEDHSQTVADETFRDQGAKMYVTTNDRNAKTHFVRALAQYDHWSIQDEKEEADFQIKLYEKQKKLDKRVWIEIYSLNTGEHLYTSPQAKAINKKMRTFNLKEQAVKNLVHNILRSEFFD